MPATNFTFEVDEDLKAAFTRVTAAQARPGSQLLQDFMRDYVRKAEHEAWFRAEVEQGLAEADDPDTVWFTQDELRVEWEAERAALQARVDRTSRT